VNTEHHAVPGRCVCFIYNQGGSLVKWYRNTFAAAEHRQAQAEGRDVYPSLFAELPDRPSSVIVLPHFTTTGPPAFITDSSGVIIGLHLDTTRGDILKGIVEGVAFYLKDCVDALPPTGIAIEDYRAVGGGSKSDAWIQVCADIMGRPFIRPSVTEAGALGAAIMAGVGKGIFSSYESAVESMVKLDRTFEPNPAMTALYADRHRRYSRLWPLLRDYLRG
jgi:xylulokinase